MDADERIFFMAAKPPFLGAAETTNGCEIFTGIGIGFLSASI
jgi:hypothetical protein